MNPLLDEIKMAFNVTGLMMYESSITAVVGTMASCAMIGPACDRFGARICIVVVFTFASIVTPLTGLIKNHSDLQVLRFFVGFAGCTFVM